MGKIFNKIRWRIAIPYVLLLIAIFVGLGIYLTNLIRRTYIQKIENELVSEARLAAAALEPVLKESITQPVAVDYAQSWAKILNSRVTIIQADGIVLGESADEPEKLENHLTRPEIQQALKTGAGISIRYSFTVKTDLMYAAAPIMNNGQVVGFVRLALSLREVHQHIAKIQGAILLTLLVATAFSILLSAWIADRTTKPLREITDTATRIAGGDLSQTHLTIPSSTDEVGQLTRALNLMSEQLHHQITDLENERTKMAAVLNEMTDGVVIADDLGQVQLINPAAESMFEVTEKQALNHTLIEVFRHYQIYDLWRNYKETGKTQTTMIDISLRQLQIRGIASPLGATLPGYVLLLFQNLQSHKPE